MPIDLSNRTWPEQNRELWRQPLGRALAGSANRTFVSEGALVAKAIDFNGQMRAIPRDSSCITALAVHDGVCYGATSGEESWLFQYALRSYCEAAIPLGPIPGCTRVTGLVAPGHNSVYLAGDDGGEGCILRVDHLHLPGDVIQEWGLPRPQYERLVVPVPGERIASLAWSEGEGLLIGLSEPGGVFFTVDPESSAVTALGPVDPVGFFGRVLVEGMACWYAFGTLGRVVRRGMDESAIHPTGIRIPTFPGRGPYAKITAAVHDRATDRLYVGDSEGLMAVVDLEAERVTTLGKPVPIGGIDHLVRLRDGRIYGVAGSRDGMAHLFVHDPREGGLRDLGVCCAVSEKGWYGYRFGAMAATSEGRILLGEDDHLGCVFSYFPPL